MDIQQLARDRLTTCTGHGGGSADATPAFQVRTRLLGSKLRAAGEVDGPGEDNSPPRRFTPGRLADVRVRVPDGHVNYVQLALGGRDESDARSVRFRKAGHTLVINRAEGGWDVGCVCGWTLPRLGTRTEARCAYTEHRINALPICARCKKPKRPEQMAEKSRHMCKRCLTDKTREWAASNPSRWEQQRRKSYLKKKYGVSAEDVDDLLIRQGGACAICGKREGDSRGFRMHIDHDHATGRVRGILCNLCNQGLGAFHDDVALMTTAIAYLAAASIKEAS
jgi:hypothetical protein